MRYFDITLSKDLLQGFGEDGMVWKGDGEGVVRGFTVSSLSSGRVRESVSNFFHNGCDPARREAVSDG